MTRVRRVGSILALLPILVLASCATRTVMETNWELPNLEEAPFTKLAVIGIMKHTDESRAFESEVIQKFEKHGVQAVPGFSFLDGKKDLTKDQMEQRVAGTHADGVLIFKIIAVDKSNRYVPPTTYVTPDVDPYDWWEDQFWGYYTPYPYGYWGYWYPAVQVVTTPGYWETSKTYRVETSLYRASDHKLVWTAVSDTFDPTSRVDLASSLSGTILKKLDKAGLVRETS